MNTANNKTDFTRIYDLINKYSGRGPRYTSYPTAPEWSGGVGENDYWRHINDANSIDHPRPISLYIHVPFCPDRCYFCACNVIVTNHEDVLDGYVDLVTREAKLIADKLSDDRLVNQFHLGGGTPTHLSPASLSRMLKNVSQLFNFEQNAERSIEVDLRITSEEHLDGLRNLGFNRISIGVQDFSPVTQQAINRKQSVEETRAFIDLCRSKGFDSINIDLVYGLPAQSVTTFSETLQTIYEINPDRIALYNWAYLPKKLAHQRRIDASLLPDLEERFAIFQSAIEGFINNGYAYIGMDHFAKPDDELTLAQRQGTLQRNFMGFTTCAGSDLHSFGVSSISSLDALYIQNVKKLKPYQDAVMNGRLPVERGIELTFDDRMRKWTIMELMCNLRVSMAEFHSIWGIEFKNYFAEELEQLKPFMDDGLIDPDITEEIKITRIGQIIIRPIAMVFDAYLKKARKSGAKATQFSQTL